VAGGTGLLPFLDLIDLIFKSLYSSTTPNPLTKHRFYFFISVAQLGELVIADQLQLLCQANSPQVQIRLRVTAGLPDWAFVGCRLEKRFGKETAAEYLRGIENLQMLYVCGPNQMYGVVLEAAQEASIGRDRVFFV
jgi:NAD(P)H-flavin reductase